MNIFSAAVPKNIILNSTMLIYQNISQYLWIFLKFIFQFLNIYGIWGNINKNRKIQYFKKLIELKKNVFCADFLLNIWIYFLTYIYFLMFLI